MRPSRRRQATEIGLARTLKWERRFVVRRPAGVAGVQRLNPRPAVVPQRRIVAGHEDRRDAITIQRPELLRHPLNDFELTPELVQLLVRTLLYQNRLRQVRGVNHDDLRAQRHCDDDGTEQRDPYTTRHDFLLVRNDPMWPYTPAVRGRS